MAKKQASKPVSNQKTTATPQNLAAEPTTVTTANQDVILLPAGINGYLRFLSLRMCWAQAS
jgi:hypothetical protein